MNKVLISVAPVDATDKNIDPISIAKDVIECSNLGAGMVHLHVRDQHGNLTSDLKLVKETINYIRKECDIIVQISTGGVSNLTIEERCEPLFAPWVEATSLNVGSVNLGAYVYQNPIKDVEYCVKQVIANKKIPEIEVFELGMIHTVKELSMHYDFVKPILFSIVLGHIGAAPATVQTLKSMLAALEEFFPNKDEVLWGLTHAHRKDFELMKVALDMGARCVRIGFEDSHLLGHNKQVTTNAQLVKGVIEVLKEKELIPMTPIEARRILHI